MSDEQQARKKKLPSQKTPRRVDIVTGASRHQGIGAAVCRALASNGCDIFFTHWSPYDLSMPWGAEEAEPGDLQQKVRSFGAHCEHLSVDLATSDAPVRILQSVEDCLGSASILVNNAVPFDQLDAPTLDAYYAVNMRGTMLLSVEFAKRFAGSTGGGSSA